MVFVTPFPWLTLLQAHSARRKEDFVSRIVTLIIIIIVTVVYSACQTANFTFFSISCQVAENYIGSLIYIYIYIYIYIR